MYDRLSVIKTHNLYIILHYKSGFLYLVFAERKKLNTKIYEKPQEI